MDQETVTKQIEAVQEALGANTLTSVPTPEATAMDILKAAMTPSEVLARPHDYEKWYQKVQAVLNG